MQDLRRVKSLNEHPKLAPINAFLQRFCSNSLIDIECNEAGTLYLLSPERHPDKARIDINAANYKESLMHCLVYNQLNALDDAVKLLFVKLSFDILKRYDDIAPLVGQLGFPTHKKELAVVLKTAGLDEQVLHFCSAKKLKWKQISQLLRFNPAHLIFLVSHAEHLHLSANHFLNLAQKLQQYAVLTKLKQAEESEPIKQIMKSETMPIKRREALEQCLDKVIYKQLQESRLEIKNKLKRLDNLSTLHIGWDTQLENRYLDLNCRVQKEADIDSFIEWLESNKERLTQVLKEL